jgi:polysaccharide pyruvyl transferase WcaK-like protein
MMSALVAQLIPLGFDTLRIASLEKQDDWRVSRAESDRIELPRGGLGPWLGFAHRIREAAALFVVGADVLDGSYGVWPSLRLLGAADLAARAGLVTTVIGCSYRTQAHPLAVRFLGFLSRRVQVLARDYYSKRRLEAVLQQPTPLVADIAFLLRPPLPGRRPWSEEFTNGFRRNGKPAPVW